MPKQSKRQESEIQNKIRLALSKHGIVFRTNSGDFWQGTPVYSKEFKQTVLINLRRVAGLPAGFTDLLYISDGSIAFIEVKDPLGIASGDQERFIDCMRELHHCAGVARSVSDALEIIGVDADRNNNGIG